MNTFCTLVGTSLASLLISGVIGFTLTSSQNNGHDPNRPEAVPIVILPNGFANPILSLPHGIYGFVVVNRTGLHTVTLYLERMPGPRTDGPASNQEFVSTVNNRDGRLVKTARLVPGTYRLRVEGRPVWVSKIQVR